MERDMMWLTKPRGRTRYEEQKGGRGRKGGGLMDCGDGDGSVGNADDVLLELRAVRSSKAPRCCLCSPGDHDSPSSEI